jgi:hypothetical protein
MNEPPSVVVTMPAKEVETNIYGVPNVSYVNLDRRKARRAMPRIR